MTPEILLVLLGWAVAGGSPGPATLAISGTAMSQGRRAGLTIASGVVAGSACWGIAAGLGMSAVMMANAWLFEAIRYAGAVYLLYLAAKALRRALAPNPVPTAQVQDSVRNLFLKGFALHLTNPKAILSWGAIYAIALPVGAGTALVWTLFATLGAVSMMVFFGYALLFSGARVSAAYLKMRRGFDGAFAALFGAASLHLLTARI